MKPTPDHLLALYRESARTLGFKVCRASSLAAQPTAASPASVGVPTLCATGPVAATRTPSASIAS